MGLAGVALRPTPPFTLLPSLVLVAACAASSPPTSAIGVSPIANAPSDSPSPDEPAFEARAEGPLTSATPLQIVSVFSYEPGETLLSPATEIASFVSDARTRHGFGKEAFQPMVVTPTPSTIKASQLVVIAWGPRAEFGLKRAKEMGHAVMRAAIEHDVEDVAYAPIVRDQGVTTIPPDEVAAAIVEGALAEFLTEQKTEPRKAIHLKHVIFEAGPAFVDAVSKGVSRGLESGRAHAEPHAK